MLLSALSAATLTISPGPAPDVTAAFDGYRRRSDEATAWERFDVVLSNTTQEPRTLSLCPSKASQIFRTHRTFTNAGFAIGFDGKGWDFNCGSRVIAPGTSVKVSVYFREVWSTFPYENEAFERSVLIRTSLGDIAIAYDFDVDNPSAGIRDIRAEFRARSDTPAEG